MREWVLERGDDGREIDARPGDVVVLRLVEHATAGYRWELAAAPESVCTLEHSTAVPPEGRAPGAAAAREFVFRVHSPGRTAISLRERRPWESESEAAAHFAVRLNVSQT